MVLVCLFVIEPRKNYRTDLTEILQKASGYIQV